jgi:ABC-type transport system involved in cytochrome bd biosynthesis fused ATPase/permease subunit
VHCCGCICLIFAVRTLLTLPLVYAQMSLRAAIGVVPQDTVLFNDTILYNIRCQQNTVWQRNDAQP